MNLKFAQIARQASEAADVLSEVDPSPERLRESTLRVALLVQRLANECASLAKQTDESMRFIRNERG